MTGSSYIPIVVPIVAFLTMAYWLAMVFRADGHPGYRKSSRPSGPAEEAATSAGAGQEPEALPDDRGRAGPRDHERIDEHAHAALLG